MRGLTVLVTRPQPGAAETAERLRALGHEPVVLPLTRIASIPNPALPDGPFDAVLLTSASAIRHAPAALIAGAKSLPAYCVGERTAAEARSAGLDRAQALGSNAAELFTAVASRMPAGARLLYLAGRVRTGTLAQDLAARGFELLLVETYDTLVESANVVSAARMVAGGKVDAVLVHSTEGGKALAEAVRASGWPKAAKVIAISDRAAAPFRAVDAEVATAAAPNEAGMLERLAMLSQP